MCPPGVSWGFTFPIVAALPVDTVPLVGDGRVHYFVEIFWNVKNK